MSLVHSHHAEAKINPYEMTVHCPEELDTPKFIQAQLFMLNAWDLTFSV
jgi:hypothetical protein